MSFTAHCSVSPAQLHQQRQEHYGQSLSITPSAISVADVNFSGGARASTGGTSGSSGIVFHATDVTGSNFASSFGDVYLFSSELHSAFTHQMCDIGTKNGSDVAMLDDVVASNDDSEADGDANNGTVASRHGCCAAETPDSVQLDWRTFKAFSAALGSVNSKAKVKAPTADGESTTKAKSGKSKAEATIGANL